MRAVLIAVLLVLCCVPFCLAPSPCHAIGMEKPSCYPGRKASPRHAPRRNRVSAVYKAAVKWLREVVGSLTHSRSSKETAFEAVAGEEMPRLWLTEFDLRGGARGRDDRIVPTLRLNLRKEQLSVGVKMRF